MKIAFLPQRLPRLAYLLFGAFETFAFVAAFSGAGASAASCTPPATDYGTDTIQQSVTTAGTYTVWSHLFAPTGSTGSYMLEVDDGGGNATCYSVGGSSVAANAWTWVNWQNTPSSVISANLTAGQYTFKLIGNSPDVELDNILLTTDTSCTPTDDGSNCSSPAPAPTVNLSADPTSVTSGDSSTLTWSSTDANSCNSSWNGTEATSGTASTGALSATTSFTLTCTGTGGTASQTATVTVTPPDGGGGGTNPTAPTISLGVQDGATVSGTTDVTVTPSNDVTQVVYSVDGAAVNTTTTAPFSYNWDTTQVNDGVHSLSATASNAAGGTATASVSVAVQNGAGGTGTGTGGGNDGGGSSDTGTGGGGSDTGGSSDQGGGDSGSSGGGGGFGDSFGLDAPTNVSASLGALDTTSLSYPVTVTWSTTDGATGYDIVLDGATIDEVDSGDTTSYDYMLPADGSTHTFQIVAFDDFGDVSDLSDGATVDASLTGNGSGATVTVPSGLKAVPSGKAQQVNLSWTDDDPSVKSYVVYRGDGSNPGSYTKVGTSKTITYGDTTVKAGSTYSYYVVAVNAGGDQSDQSSSANATVSTSQASGGGGDGGTVVGIIRASDGHKPIIGAQVMFALSGKTYVFTTDGDGMYVIPDMGSGPYTISFSAPGYKATSSTVQINAGVTADQNMTLTRSAGGSAAWKHWDFWNYL